MSWNTKVSLTTTRGDEANLWKWMELLDAFLLDCRDSVNSAPGLLLMISIAFEACIRWVQILISVSNICNTIEKDKETIEAINSDFHNEMIVIQSLHSKESMRVQSLHSEAYSDHMNNIFDSRKVIGGKDMAKYWVNISATFAHSPDTLVGGYTIIYFRQSALSLAIYWIDGWKCISWISEII